MKIVIVSNRLPITVLEKESKFKYVESVGGLVTGIKSFLENSKSNYRYIWVGWPGSTIKEEEKEKLKKELMSKFNCYPIYLPEKSMEKFYHGFCNKTIWPLFHYFPSYAIYEEENWLHYKNVNKIFCENLLKIINSEDIIWIHDYHLMLLPKLLREKVPDITIGFFLHIPFPSFEIYRLLPSKWRKEILEGILGADLVGFHTHDYMHHFLRCILRILGYENETGQIIANDRIIKVDIFPMGIDFKKLFEYANNEKVKKEKKSFENIFKKLRVIFSIDRLDYTKGILNRLHGFEFFLEKYPKWHRKVVLVLVIVPSRTGVEYYQLMKRQIDELVGKINGKFGTIDWTPILYQYKFLPIEQLIALYNLADVALITPLRDGMNLISKEYIATKTDQTGVLILSEMAGASKELGEAIIVNPTNKEEIAEAIKTALEMSIEEQILRNRIMQERLKRYDVIRWGNDFITELLEVKEKQKSLNTKVLPENVKEKIIKDYLKAKKRLIFLDYDGTLIPFQEKPELAKPTKELIMILEDLAKDSKNEIILISGRDRKTLQNWFKNLNISLVAEHGAWIKEKGKDWKVIKPIMSNWKSKVLPILEMYVDRLPGSFIEEKDFSVVWHYRKADPELSSLRAKELIDDLIGFSTKMEFQILQGSKVVEIRSIGINKGSAALYFKSKDKYDFILAIGDDWTDEDLFKALQEAYTIRVGIVQTFAKFNLHNYLEVLDFLKRILNSKKIYFIQQER